MPGARAFARRVLDDWGVRGRTDDVLLCVSELATNALLHGVPPGRGFLLRLLPYPDGIRVEVHDSGGGVPAVPEDAPDESGRGRAAARERAGGQVGRGGAGPRQGRMVRVRYDGRSVPATAAMVSGPTRQQPPISRAPDSRHPVTREAVNVGRPVQARAPASQVSPLLG